MFEIMAEARMREAVAKGDLKDLPGQGKPLNLDDENPFIPADKRMVFHILKNAGMVPEEVAIRQEVEKLKKQLEAATDEAQKKELRKKLEQESIRHSILMERFYK
ncbi:DUF1992 domain-containing protein [Heliophilum fasciatum]|nr:DUF1992 domain-containing protein [Heliophilum fasciatum]